MRAGAVVQVRRYRRRMLRGSGGYKKPRLLPAAWWTFAVALWGLSYFAGEDGHGHGWALVAVVSGIPLAIWFWVDYVRDYRQWKADPEPPPYDEASPRI